MLLKEIADAVEVRVAKAVRDATYRRYVDVNQAELAKALIRLLDQSHCLLASSGTAALEIGLRGIGVRPGDQVVMSAYDYPGNFWAIERLGARPLLIDLEPSSWRVDLNQLRSALQDFPTASAVVVSHLHSESQDIESINEICREFNRPWIEDCCQSIAGRVGETRLGSLSDANIVSFGGGKLLSAGRGGALLTNSEDIYQKSKIAAGAGSGPYGLSEMQAAMVLAQISFVDRLVKEICHYFIQVHHALGATSDTLTLPGKLEIAEQVASIYQVGWLLPSDESSSACDVKTRIENAKAQTHDPRILSVLDSLGSGFPGFHRRSQRRCTRPYSLDQAKRAAEQTLVVHHRIALDATTPANELADTIRLTLNALN